MPSPTALYLLPGLLCDDALWYSQAKSLAGIADIVIPSLTRESSVEEMAAAVLKPAPDTFALAGLSMGGYVAQEIMRREPGRVSHLALLDTSYYAEVPERAEIRRAYIEGAREGRFDETVKGLRPLLTHPSRSDDAALSEVIAGMARRVGPESYICQQTAILNRPDGAGDLAAISCPTLVLCGRQDALTPLSHHEEMAEKIPNSTLTVIDDCGHLATLERPKAVNEALRVWLLE
jgi:pimeloyl-ACP methyl ester carboxylesterase